MVVCYGHWIGEGWYRSSNTTSAATMKSYVSVIWLKLSPLNNSHGHLHEYTSQGRLKSLAVCIPLQLLNDQVLVLLHLVELEVLAYAGEHIGLLGNHHLRVGAKVLLQRHGRQAAARS